MAGSTWTLTGNSSGAQSALKGAGSAFSMLGNVVTGVNQALELGAKVLGVAKKGWEAFDKYAVQVAKDVAVGADNLAKFSRTMGENTADMQAWRSAAGMAGIEEGKLDKAVLKANKAILDQEQGLSTTTKLFDQMGISSRGAGGELKTGTELLSDMADSFRTGVIPEGQQAAITMQLLGDRTGMMAGFLRQGSDVVDEAADRLERYGAVMSDELLAVSEQYIDSTQRRTEAESGFKNAIAEGTLPALTALNNTYAELIGGQEGLRESLKTLASKWIPAVAHALIDVVGYVVRVGNAFKYMFLRVGAIVDRAIGKIVAGFGEMWIKISDGFRAMGLDKVADVYLKVGAAAKQFAKTELQMAHAADTAADKVERQNDEIERGTELMHRALDAQLGMATATEDAATGGEGAGGEATGGEGAGGEAPAGVGDEAEIQAEKVTGAVDSMTEDYARLGESIGGNIASIITAEDKTQAAKDAVKQMAIEGIKYLGQMAMTAIAGRSAIATTNVASSVAETAAATPAAIVGAIASEGANVGLASAAIAGGVALMSGIISGIGDRGIPAGLLGPGRHTVIMRGDEAITDPSETASQVRVGQRLEQAMGNGGGGGGADLLASAFGGGGGRQVTVPVVMQFPWGEFMDYFDVDITERTELGIGPFGTGALGVSG